MADAKSLRVIGYGLSTLTMIVTILATVLVAEATSTPSPAPMEHATAG